MGHLLPEESEGKKMALTDQWVVQESQKRQSKVTMALKDCFNGRVDGQKDESTDKE
jgi:hypothetical protein